MVSLLPLSTAFRLLYSCGVSIQLTRFVEIDLHACCFMFQLLGTENRTNFGKNETTEINDIVILYVLEHKGSDEPRMEQLIIGQLVCRRTINLLFILNDLCGQGQLR